MSWKIGAVIGLVFIVIGLVGWWIVTGRKFNFSESLVKINGHAKKPGFYLALICIGALIAIGIPVCGGIGLFINWLISIPVQIWAWYWNLSIWTGGDGWLGSFWALIAPGVRWVVLGLVALVLVNYAWSIGSAWFANRRERKEAKKKAPQDTEVSPRQIGLGSILVPVEQYWTALVYWNIFGKGRGKIAYQVKEHHTILGMEIGYALKIPFLMDAEIHRVTKITVEFPGDAIPNRGFKPFSAETEDFMADEMKSLGRDLPFPKMSKRPMTGMIASTSTFTFQVTYRVTDMIKFIGLEKKFRDNPVLYIESVVTGYMQQFIPTVFSDDTAVIDGKYILLGAEHEAAGFVTDVAYRDYETKYPSAEGKKHWDAVNTLKFHGSTTKSRWRFNLEPSEIAELEKLAPDCPYLLILDKGIEVVDFKRQKTAFPKNVQDLYDQRAEAELKRMINITSLQQRLDNARVEIVERLMQAKATVDNLIQRMVQLKAGLERAMTNGQPLQWAEVFEYTAADELLRVMRIAPEGKYALVGSLRDFMKTVAGYAASSGLAGPQGVVEPPTIVPGR